MSNSNLFALRIALFFGGLLGAVFFNPVVPVIAIIALSFLFASWEAVLIGLFIDLAYLPPGGWPLFTLGAITVVWILEPVRREFLA